MLENRTVFGTVNANRRHYEEAARVLALRRTSPGWGGWSIDGSRSADSPRRMPGSPTT